MLYPVKYRGVSCPLTVSAVSSLAAACVVARLRDAGPPSVHLGVRGDLRPVVAVFSRVAVATLPLHLCHHLVSHLVPRPPVGPVAEDDINTEE